MVNLKLFLVLRITEVWSGVNNGAIITFDFDNSSGIPISQQQANMQHSTNRSSANSSVAILLSSNTSVYSYLSPGCVLYQWDARTKKIRNQLDCLKLVPCSESLGSISIDKNLSIGRCQITAACLLNENVYLGTSWGCLIVADKMSLVPVIVFRPFEEEVQYIAASPRDCNETSTIVTIGKGYRSLINRFTDTQLNSNHQYSITTALRKELINRIAFYGRLNIGRQFRDKPMVSIDMNGNNKYLYENFIA